MNTKLKKKAAAWSLYQVLGLVMILSMVFAAPLAVLGESIDWTEPEPPDAPPGSIITIKVGDSPPEIIYDKTIDPVVMVTGPNGYSPECVSVGWSWVNLEEQVWTCEIQLSDDPAVSIGYYEYVVTQGDIVEYGSFTDAIAVDPKRSNINPGEYVVITASGGFSPYIFEIFQDQSGGSLSEATDTSVKFTAGSGGIGKNIIDIVRATDVKGNTSDAFVYVGNMGNGETVEGPCVVDVLGSSLTCTANDISLAYIDNIDITDPCEFPGDTITFTADFYVQTTATSNYDVGLWFAIDGDPNGDGAYTGDCSISSIPYSPDPPFIDLEGLTDGIQDTCGDITKGAHSNGLVYNPIAVPIELTVVCRDDDGDGKMDLPYVATWDNNSNTLCTSPLDTVPGTGSKCNASPGFSVDIPVPGQIIVIKDTGEVISPEFGFTVREKIDENWDVRNTFNLTGQSDPWESVGYYAGTYMVEETYVPTGWTPSDTAVICESEMYPLATIDPLAIDLNPGEIITCTFYNEQNTGTIIIEKESIFGAGTFDFTSPGLGDNSFMITTAWDAAKEKYLDSKTFSEVVTGTYVVTETGPTGWSLVDLKCDDSDSTVDLATKKATIKLAPDETVTCRFVNKKQLADLTVTKTALPTFTRTWDWDITKTADDPTTKYGAPGAMVPFDYDVEVDATYQDSAWAISGMITVTNPNAVAFELDSLTDMAGTTPCTLNPVGPYVVPADGNLQVGYTCTFTSGASGTNTATATWDDDYYNTPTGTDSGSATYAFSTPTTQIDEEIEVTDSKLTEALGTVSALTDTLPYTFTTYQLEWLAVAGICKDILAVGGG